MASKWGMCARDSVNALFPRPKTLVCLANLQHCWLLRFSRCLQNLLTRLHDHTEHISIVLLRVHGYQGQRGKRSTQEIIFSFPLCVFELRSVVSTISSVILILDSPLLFISVDIIESRRRNPIISTISVNFIFISLLYLSSRGSKELRPH